MHVKQKAYIVSGFVCVALGIAGIPLPLLPTTPFLLLAAFCFARGSERWHRWLLTHPTLSPYILAFRDKRGLTRGQKIRLASLVTLTLMVTGALAPFYGKALALVIWSTTMLYLYFSPPAPSN